MIMAYDKGEWHPDAFYLDLWLLIALASLIPLFLIARGRQLRVAHYLGAALPLFALFILMIYLNFGRSGAYTGQGTIGPGAWVNLPDDFAKTGLGYLIGFWPSMIVVSMAQWNALRLRLPVLFWAIYALALVIQIVLILFVWAIFDTP